MTEQEQQIALCEWMGWEWHNQPGTGCYVSPDKQTAVRRWQDLPDTSSLDVLHEMELRLIDGLSTDGYGRSGARIYSDKLKSIIQDTEMLSSAVESRYKTAIATAPQRREALLRTLGLWKD